MLKTVETSSPFLRSDWLALFCDTLGVGFPEAEPMARTPLQAVYWGGASQDRSPRTKTTRTGQLKNLLMRRPVLLSERLVWAIPFEEHMGFFLKLSAQKITGTDTHLLSPVTHWGGLLLGPLSSLHVLALSACRPRVSAATPSAS